MSRIFAIAVLVTLFSQSSAAPTTSSNSYGSGSSNGNPSSYGGNNNAMANDWKAKTTTMMENSETTTTAMAAKATTMYGSGYKNWGGSGYNGCVQQCMAQYGAPPSSYTPPTTNTSSDMGSQGSGTPTTTSGAVTHTVVVAPTQGVLRFVPFAVNASVGDTVRFIWGAGPHTVTQSSILTPCNKSLAQGAFASGAQNKSFVFDQVINTTDPTFYYCGIPTHCQKGMFGIINPPSAPTVNSNVTVGSWMMNQAQSNPSMSALWSYVSNATTGTSASGWGMKIDMSSMPSSAYSDIVQNTMYSALFYAANPGMLEKGQGAADVSGNGMTIPQDITQTLSQLAVSTGVNATSSSADTAAASAQPTGGSSGYATSSAVSSSSGHRVVSSTAVMGLAALLASFAIM